MRALDRFGRATIDFFEYAGGLALLSAESLGFMLQLRIRIAETISQAALLGVQSLLIVCLTSLFTGMVISLESAQQAVAYGVSNLVGGAVAYASVRELGPMLTGVVVAGRVGAAIAAELGSMVVTEQIEALRSMGVEPPRFLVVPRLLALLLMLPLLTIFADVVSIAGGAWIAQTYAHIPYDSFVSSIRESIDFSDVVKGLVKSVVFAAIIALVGAYQGLSTRGGAAGVGRSTTFAVVLAIILIFASNFLLSFLLFGGR
ncbi:MAG: ABC transporter permease [Candidatus Eremiobacteraeota bacterium]|nr:ABC transporter permease [Candidatus Eremiobacteraeota bacterium]MBV9056502.1 ABC transporter permease [Candidatus Eremiobacteraeota bacterium]MBV9699557.1 ABC transporter permease [Candidatus Eremiobacteraeota bacterium]